MEPPPNIDPASSNAVGEAAVVSGEKRATDVMTLEEEAAVGATAEAVRGT